MHNHPILQFYPTYGYALTSGQETLYDWYWSTQTTIKISNQLFQEKYRQRCDLAPPNATFVRVEQTICRKSIMIINFTQCESNFKEIITSNIFLLNHDQYCFTNRVFKVSLVPVGNFISVLESLSCMVTVAFFTSPSIYPSRAAAAATSEIEFASSLATSREKWSEASTAAGCRHWRSHSVRRRGVWAYIENEGGQPTVSFRSYLDSACLRLAGLVAQHLAAFLNVTVHFRLCRTSHLMHCKFIYFLPYLELRNLSFGKLRGSCF